MQLKDFGNRERKRKQVDVGLYRVYRFKNPGDGG